MMDRKTYDLHKGEDWIQRYQQVLKDRDLSEWRELTKPTAPIKTKAEPELSTWWRKLRARCRPSGHWQVQVKYVWLPFWYEPRSTGLYKTKEGAVSAAKRWLGLEIEQL